MNVQRLPSQFDALHDMYQDSERVVQDSERKEFLEKAVEVIPVYEKVGEDTIVKLKILVRTQ